PGSRRAARGGTCELRWDRGGGRGILYRGGWWSPPRNPGGRALAAERPAVTLSRKRLFLFALPVVQLARTGRGADEAGLAAELGVADLRLRRRYREGQPLDVPADALQERLAGRDHAAGEDHHVGVDGVHQVGRPHRQVVGRVLDDLLGQGVA